MKAQDKAQESQHLCKSSVSEVQRHNPKHPIRNTHSKGKTLATGDVFRNAAEWDFPPCLLHAYLFDTEHFEFLMQALCSDVLKSLSK